MKKDLVLVGLIHKEHGIFLKFTEQFHVFQYMDLHCHSDCSYYRDYHHGHYDGNPEHNYRLSGNWLEPLKDVGIGLIVLITPFIVGSLIN